MKNKKFLILLIIGLGFFIYHTYFREIEGNILVTEDYKTTTAYINDLYKSDEFFKKHLLSPEDYYIYEEMLRASKERIFELTIPCEGNDCKVKVERSFNAIYLDHPELLSYLGSATYYNGNINYSTYTNLGGLKLYLATERIERILDKIKKETKDMSEQEKIIYVYDYVASHNYDTLFSLTKENQTAYSFFTGGKSVCAGFAKAAQLIFQNIGINSMLVLTSDHMWNYVEYKGKYYVFDATVGASLFKKDDYRFYNGLGETTIDKTTGLYKEYYPNISTTKLKDIFGL